jgi:arylsulfatase A-like enzyme
VVGGPWIDGEVDISSLGQTDGTAVSVSVDAPKGNHGFLALAAPRLVTPNDSSATTGPTNVLIYMIDTLRPDHTSVYGYERPTTPRLDALARRAVVFENAYSAAAWTRPATASLLTSLHSSFHGAHSTNSLASEVVTLAERFRVAGWSTWAFVTNGHVFDRSLNFEQGFDRFVAIRGVKRDNHARTEEVNELVLPHLDAFGDEPFLLYVHVVDPHSPYDPPEGYRGLFSDPSYSGPVTPKDTVKRVLRRWRLSDQDVSHIRSLYDEDIRYQDEMMGVLLERLDQMAPTAGETLVVVTSDHGEEFFEHGDWEHGTRLYEEQVRIPLVLRVPGVPTLAGRRVKERVQIIDIMPTLLAWFGIAGGEMCQGIDLGPMLRAAPESGVGSRSVYCEELRGEKNTELRSLTEGPWKIIHRRVGPREHYSLFDLEEDPGELRDRSGSQRERLVDLRTRLADHADALAKSYSRATGGRPQDLDDATREQLEALGYLNTRRP